MSYSDDYKGDQRAQFIKTWVPEGSVLANSDVPGNQYVFILARMRAAEDALSKQKAALRTLIRAIES